MGLDCGRMFSGKYVASFSKPKLSRGKNNLRELTALVRITHPEFNSKCGFWKVLKPLWYGPWGWVSAFGHLQLFQGEPTCHISSAVEGSGPKRTQGAQVEASVSLGIWGSLASSVLSARDCRGITTILGLEKPVFQRDKQSSICDG